MNGAPELWGFPLLALPGRALRGPILAAGVRAALLGVEQRGAVLTGRYAFRVPFAGGWLAVTVNGRAGTGADVWTVGAWHATGAALAGSVTPSCVARWYRVGAGDTCGGLPLGTAAYLRGIVARHGLQGGAL